MIQRTFTSNGGEVVLGLHQAELYYEVIGKKGAPCIVLLPGGLATVSDFNTFTPYLSLHYQLIGIDFRGQGRSSLGTIDRLTYPLLMDDVERILVKLGIEHAGFIGFSDGGTVGYHLGNSQKIKMDWLISIGGTWCYQDTQGTDHLTPAQCQALFPAFYNLYQDVNPDQNFMLVAQLVVAMWRDGSNENLPLDLAKQLKCPVLIVCGEKDTALLPESALKLAQQITNSSLFIVPFIGHDAFNVPNNLFVEGMLHFLTRVRST